MIDSKLLNIFLHNLQCRNRCLRNFVIQTHYTIIPKPTLLQDRVGVFLNFVTRPHKETSLSLERKYSFITQFLFQILVTYLKSIFQK
jgi:hypothetical protein